MVKKSQWLTIFGVYRIVLGIAILFFSIYRTDLKSIPVILDGISIPRRPSTVGATSARIPVALAFDLFQSLTVVHLDEELFHSNYLQRLMVLDY